MVGRARVGVTDKGVGICEYMKVELTREAQGLVYFKILDDNSGLVRAGEECFLHKGAADKYLSDVGPVEQPAIVRVQYGEKTKQFTPFKGQEYLQQWATESFNGITANVTLNSIWGQQFTPLVPGHYTIFAPNQSHGNISTAGYVQATPGLRCTDVWFPIGTGQIASSRFIHVGNISEGCITTYELSRWDALYDYLIAHRMPGSVGKYVGQVIVTK